MDRLALLTAGIEPYDYTLEATPLSAWELSDSGRWKLEDFACQLWQGGPQLLASAKKPRRIRLSEDPRPPKTYWYFVKAEFRKMICEESQEYKDLWADLAKIQKRTAVAVVGVVSAYLSSKLGVEATLLVQFCAVCLYALAKLGKNAFCEQTKENDA